MMKKLKETTTADAGMQTSAPTGGKYYYRFPGTVKRRNKEFISLFINKLSDTEPDTSKSLAEFFGMEWVKDENT
jgi:hypothetical protein